MEWVGIGIAIYAGLLSTAVALWQVRTARRADATDVRVAMHVAVMGFPDVDRTVVTVEASNHSRHEVVITAAGFERVSDRQVVQVVRPQLGATIPGSLAPRDSGMTYLVRDEAREAGLLGVPVRGWVRTAIGERFYSPEDTFNPDY